MRERTDGVGDRLCRIELDGDTLRSANAVIERERAIAIQDLLACNEFGMTGGSATGPFVLHMAADADRLVWTVTTEARDPVGVLSVPILPMKTVIKSYLSLLDSYETALREGRPDALRLIDQTRRAIHDEGAKRLASDLSAKIRVDDNTARGLFTLVISLVFNASSVVV